MKKFVSLVVAAIFAIMPFVAIAKRQAIFDWWRLRDYSPSARIVGIADLTTMTETGRHLFYVYHPELQDKASFNESCDFNEQSIVLGCYVSGRGIYIYDVTDERLQGIQEVTAAHEVLHVAYERLSSKEQQRIDLLTLETFNGLDNQRIKDTVEAYRKRDPSIVANELHSILATEVRQLPSELEDYYKRYFADRSAIVNYSERYEQAFSELKEKESKLISDIERIQSEIDSLSAELESEKQAIDREFQQLQRDRPTADPSTFNPRVNSFNLRVSNYNARVEYSRSLIDEHNRVVAEFNLLVLESRELIEAIDSRPETIEQE